MSRRSIFSVMSNYRIEKPWQQDQSGNWIIILSGRWKSGTRFRYCGFTLTTQEYSQFISEQRNSTLNEILS